MKLSLAVLLLMVSMAGAVEYRVTFQVWRGTCSKEMSVTQENEKSAVSMIRLGIANGWFLKSIEAICPECPKCEPCDDPEFEKMMDDMERETTPKKVIQNYNGVPGGR